MDKTTSQPVPKCGIDYAFRRIGGKYKGRILWRLRTGTMRYGELRRAITGITPKMLAQTLHELEADGLILRKVYAEVPPKVEYTLSATGEKLLPFFTQLREWAREQMIENQIEMMPGSLL